MRARMVEDRLPEQAPGEGLDLSFDRVSNVVDVHLANLRQKLRAGGDPPLVRTVGGVGYVLPGEDGAP
ncbi:MAG: helix-turn-helix domain-containing protein [Gemmatimonadota bacterium]